MKKKHKDDVKIFKFITFKQKNKVNVGRKKDVDVRISDDISVSRIHATLKYRPDTR
jgi:pSer/pThr/pTyr-binding forkhead associated (FHA) protein